MNKLPKYLILLNLIFLLTGATAIADEDGLNPDAGRGEFQGCIPNSIIDFIQADQGDYCGCEAICHGDGGYSTGWQLSPDQIPEESCGASWVVPNTSIQCISHPIYHSTPVIMGFNSI